MIINDTYVPLSIQRLLLLKGEYIDNSLRVFSFAYMRILNNNTSVVNASAYFPVNNMIKRSVISQEWFYTTLPDQQKMAKHTFTISTYSDDTLSNKIGEITFSANLSDYGEQGVITEKDEVENSFNVNIFFVQSAYGIYDKIHKVILANFNLYGFSQFIFVKKY